jgi:hypothetical protein
LLGLYLKAVVGRTSLSAETQADLVEKPDGNAWRKAEVETELSRELGDAFQPFIGLLTKICATLARQIRSAVTVASDLADDELVSRSSAYYSSLTLV